MILEHIMMPSQHRRFQLDFIIPFQTFANIQMTSMAMAGFIDIHSWINFSGCTLMAVICPLTMDT